MSTVYRTSKLFLFGINQKCRVILLFIFLCLLYIAHVKYIRKPFDIMEENHFITHGQVYSNSYTKMSNGSSIRSIDSIFNSKGSKPVQASLNSPIDIAVIFMNVGDNNVLKYNLRRSISTLLANTKAAIRLHVITDNSTIPLSRNIIDDVVSESEHSHGNVQKVFVTPEHLITEVEDSVKILQEYFTNSKYSKYRDFLFFFSLFFYQLLPGLTKIILMDIDIVVKGDISELFTYFSLFSDDHVIGICPELSPVYRHILSTYRNEHSQTSLGSPLSKGGFPGLNSGILLINIPRLMNSAVFKAYLRRDVLDKKTKEYNFKGHLGDQDLFTLMAFDHPEVFYVIPCNWNRQLCKWWNIKLYNDVFDQYFDCPGPTKILHGNCKTPLPIS